MEALTVVFYIETLCRSCANFRLFFSSFIQVGWTVRGCTHNTKLYKIGLSVRGFTHDTKLYKINVGLQGLHSSQKELSQLTWGGYVEINNF